MNPEQLQQLLEAALFAAPKAMTAEQLKQQLAPLQQVSLKQIQQQLQSIQAFYQERGVQLVKVASGYRFQTRPELGAALAGMWEEKPPRYSAALLETLALIAYRQPITRAEIEEVRGVSVSSQIMKTLQEREWVEVVGHKDVPGRPQLYATTPAFLDYFNLSDLAELPVIDEPESITAETATNEE
ncbi:SMC-Scp complex subunit ScpB [Idiomarina tyrosinivorans]|uniref:SMC-Scp complex subunit ScpB n=1 Tax=Idiomarina tyrosinivorans TaxID=1445662 RepID=A0A432ZLI8_9GAMM|nr:SMC-Scp complex subunit ScpB [Idiomarina tyrosinivorans]RUO78851.1 SMC-Scp complex subunit ScpB [Idiomarina tyrosinivorans]